MEAQSQSVLKFTEVTEAVEIRGQRPSFKYGGPTVADFNADGYYDLFLGRHRGKSLMYLGKPDGTFMVHPTIAIRGDYHAAAVARRTATSNDTLIVFSTGKSFTQSETHKNAPVIYLTRSNGTTALVSTQFGFGTGNGARGRISAFADLSMKTKRERIANLGGPDILLTQFLGFPRIPGRVQFAYENNKGDYEYRNVPVYDLERQGRFELTDIDGDGIMEVISFPVFTIYKLDAPFRFRNATAEFASSIYLENYTQMAVCEIDFDNDGDFDLYIARGWETLAATRFQPFEKWPDKLLENRNGVYVDVTAEAGLDPLMRTRSMGVSPGDFNNDGYIDLMVTRNEGPDVLLINNGDGTFRGDNIGGAGPVPKGEGIRSDNSVAVDFDSDGRVDVIQGQGMSKGTHIGIFRVVKNTSPMDQIGNFLLIRVGNAPDRSSTPLHAVVTVVALVNGPGTARVRTTQRAGSRGVQKGGPSNLDTVHFGLGQATRAISVTVRWASGTSRKIKNVAGNRKIEVGLFREETETEPNP